FFPRLVKSTEKRFQPAQVAVIDLQVVGGSAPELLLFFQCQLHLEREHDLLPDLILQGKDLGEQPVITLTQQTTEGELYAGNAQSSSCLTGEPVAYLLMFSYWRFSAKQIKRRISQHRSDRDSSFCGVYPELDEGLRSE